MRNALSSLLSFLLLLATCSTAPKPPKNEKIWLHRANAVEKARRFQYDYPGFEIDLQYDDSLHTFFVKHDTDEPSCTTLDAWCDSLDNVSNMGLWFDFKNLNRSNRDEALECLKAIRQRHHLQGKLYVEASPYYDLKPFHEAGFLVSFYVPFFNPYRDDSATCCKHLPTIQDAIDSGVDAISGYEFQYLFLKAHFPDQTKLIWALSSDSAYLKQVIKGIGNDSLVDVLLLPDNAFRFIQQ
ncbi:MAG: hypothetical protein J5831_01795 [Bacteroidales bacterium]|nr:hypothetical protein [Bacteroidales bacterium]